MPERRVCSPTFICHASVDRGEYFIETYSMDPRHWSTTSDIRLNVVRWWFHDLPPLHPRVHAVTARPRDPLYSRLLKSLLVNFDEATRPSSELCLLRAGTGEFIQSCREIIGPAVFPLVYPPSLFDFYYFNGITWRYTGNSSITWNSRTRR